MINTIIKYFLFGICICLGSNSYAQNDTIQPVYLRFPVIPQFTINKANDSSAFTRDDLKKRKETVFIVFSPDCDHCQKETKDLLAAIDKFSKVQIIMITSLAYDQMKLFYEEFKIANYPIITMGHDPIYFFHTFFNTRYLPAIFIYDKRGKFKKAFEGSVKIEKIIESL